MYKFSWSIDATNYLSNSHKHGDKLNFKKFIKTIALELDNYKSKNWQEVEKMPNNHYCPKLSIKKSNEAKKLAKHLEKINEQAGKNESIQFEPFQIAIRNFPDKKEFRVFGYRKYNNFYLVYLDPDHKVYKE